MLSVVEWRLLVLWVLACTAIGGPSCLPTLSARRAVQATQSGNAQYPAARNMHRAVALLSLVPGVTATGPNLNCVQDLSPLPTTVVVPPDPSSLTATVVGLFVVAVIVVLYFWIRGASTQYEAEARGQQRLEGMTQDDMEHLSAEVSEAKWKIKRDLLRREGASPCPRARRQVETEWASWLATSATIRARLEEGLEVELLAVKTDLLAQIEVSQRQGSTRGACRPLLLT